MSKIALDKQKQLIQKAKNLKLDGMASSLENQFENLKLFARQSFEERLEYCLIAQEDYERKKQFDNLVKAAKFKDHLQLTDLNYSASQGISQQLVANLSDNGWISTPCNLILVGAAGVGKTTLSCALSINANKQGYSALYFRTIDLLMDLKSREHKSKMRLMARISRIDVLILDDFGNSELTNEDADLLYEIVDNRYKNKPIIFASQLKTSAFRAWLGVSGRSDGLLDRILHPSLIIELKGESRRKEKGAKYLS